MNVQDSLKHLTTEEVKQIYVDNAFEDAVCILNLSGDINVGMALRTSSLFGVSKFYIIGRRKYDKRGNVGMDKYIEVVKITSTEGFHNEEFDTEKLIEILSDLSRIYNLIFIEQGGSNVVNYFNTYDKKGKPCLFIAGNEGIGIPKEITSHFRESAMVEIPQKGVGRSFNVACAISIVLYEFYREKI